MRDIRRMNIGLEPLPEEKESEGCLFSLATSRAGTAADTVALEGLEGFSVTYGSLATHVDRTVKALNEMGIGRGDRVAMVLPNGIDMAVSFLSVSACATCAPLNHAYRASEFEFYLKDLNARALIVYKDVKSSARTVARSLGIPVIELHPSEGAEGFLFKLRGKALAMPQNGGYAQPKDTALVLHTSGTTSRPKIVPLTHANLYVSALNIRRGLLLSEEDVCLNIMPLFHIHGLVGALASTLSAGGKVVCSPGFDDSRFFDWVKAFLPTWYTAVPTMHQAIISRIKSSGQQTEWPSLRFIRSCSSPLPPLVLKDLENKFKVPVIESYGMTEASHQIASNPLPPGSRKIGSVGLPTGTKVGIMNETGRLLPPGDSGEIVIQGKNVTSGYENNPTANQTGFTDGWFRTGDQGVLDTDGYLYITGRIKEIINRAGEKIAPREVDEVLLEHPSVAQAVTFAVPHKTIGEDMAAAVVIKEGATVSQKELRAFAFDKLADFKVPSQIVFVDAVPKGATGKIQRIGLAGKLASRLKKDFVAPGNSIAEVLVKIWGAVLNISEIGVHDNFFYLGGDSLLAQQVIARIRDAFSIDLQLGSLFRGPTVDEQTLAVEEMLLDELEALPEKEAVRLDESPP